MYITDETASTKIQSYRDAAESARVKFANDASNIQSDDRTSDLVKNEHLDRARETALQKITDAQASEQGFVADAILGLEREVFGAAAGASVDEIVAVRDAQERVSKVKEDQELLDMLRNAEVASDVWMQRAVAARAETLALTNVVDAYVQSSPHVSKSYELLQALRNVQHSLKTDFFTYMGV